MKYVDVHGLLPRYDALAFRGPLLVSGPKGSGKSLSLHAWTETRRVPVVTCDCSEDMRRAHLLGQFTLRGDESPFIEGPVLRAIRLANTSGDCCLVFEELNALSPIAQKVLNPLTDWRQAIYIPELETTMQLNEESRLWVVGTANHASYGGVYALNEDLVSRFRMMHVPYPMPQQERTILQDVVQLGGDVDVAIRGLLRLAQESRSVGETSLGYGLSTRDLVQALEDVPVLGVRGSLELLLGKFPDETREMARRRARSIFPSAMAP